jgi:hypothetical protein
LQCCWAVVSTAHASPTRELLHVLNTIRRAHAGSGPSSRKTQLFISYKETSKKLGTKAWETPLGTVIHGMENAQQFYSYGDMPPWGNGPLQGKIRQGPDYIEDNFPLTDRFETCTVQRKSHEHEKDDHEKVANQEAASSSFRIVSEKKTINDHNASSTEKLTFAEKDGISPGGGSIIVVVVGISIIMWMIRSRRKTLSKTS